MATYASSSDLNSVFGGSDDLVWITDPSNTTADSNAITAALTTATSIIDSHALGTPGATTGTAGALWASTPDQAKYACAWIALYLLYVQIRREEPPTHVKAMYDFWAGPETGQLTLLRQGKVSWYVSEQPAAQNVGTVWAFTAGSTARDDNPRRTLRDSLDLL
jgi:hypothetical protein